MPWLLLLLAAAVTCVASSPAQAAGGGHIIDDAFVVTPGQCQADAWATRLGDGNGLVALSPACTLSALPDLEIGINVQQLWHRGPDETLVGPALKLAGLAFSDHAHLAISAGANWSTLTDRVETASVIVPLSLDLSDHLRLNLNAGWLWTRTGDAHALFYGAQMEWTVSSQVSLMAEAFDRSNSDPGIQCGVRWTPLAWIDIDLLAGYRIDGISGADLTLGITTRY
jgi:hypothetical protein